MYTLITPKKTLGAEPNFDVGARQNLAVLKYILTLSKTREEVPTSMQIAPHIFRPLHILHIDISKALAIAIRTIAIAIAIAAKKAIEYCNMQ